MGIGGVLNRHGAERNTEQCSTYLWRSCNTNDPPILELLRGEIRELQPELNSQMCCVLWYIDIAVLMYWGKGQATANCFARTFPWSFSSTCCVGAFGDIKRRWSSVTSLNDRRGWCCHETSSWSSKFRTNVSRSLCVHAASWNGTRWRAWQYVPS